MIYFGQMVVIKIDEKDKKKRGIAIIDIQSKSPVITTPDKYAQSWSWATVFEWVS